MRCCKTKKISTKLLNYWCQFQIYDEKKQGAIKYLSEEKPMLDQMRNFKGH